MDNDVVVGVDREKLYSEPVDLEDLTNHAVVVTHIENDIVTVFDPYEEPYISNIQTFGFPKCVERITKLYDSGVTIS